MSRFWNWLERSAERQREDLLDRISEKEREAPQKALQKLQAMSRSSEGKGGIGRRLLLTYEMEQEKLQAKQDVAKRTAAVETGQRDRVIGLGDYRPKCPTCGSPNVEKIPTNWQSSDPDIVKGEAIRTLLLGKRKNVKQFRCLNCRYEW